MRWRRRRREMWEEIQKRGGRERWRGRGETHWTHRSEQNVWKATGISSSASSSVWLVHSQTQLGSYFEDIQDFSSELSIHVHSAKGRDDGDRRRIQRSMLKARSVRHSVRNVDLCIIWVPQKPGLRSSSKPRTAIKFTACSTPLNTDWRVLIYTKHVGSSLPLRSAHTSTPLHPSTLILHTPYYNRYREA